MRLARSFSLLALAALLCARAAWARASSPASRASAVACTSDLTIQRTLIKDADAAHAVGDDATARAKAAEAVASLITRSELETGAAWLDLLESAGLSARSAQDPRTANSAFTRVLDVRSRTLPDEHPDLQRARSNLAQTLSELDDYAAARALQEKVLEVYSRTLPDDHPDVQAARTSLAFSIMRFGDFAGTRALLQRVLEVDTRTLPDDHPELQQARMNVAMIMKAFGECSAARPLEEQVLEVLSRTLPEDDPDLQRVRIGLSLTLTSLGEIAAARELQEQAFDVFSRTLSEDHPVLRGIRDRLAGTIEVQLDYLVLEHGANAMADAAHRRDWERAADMIATSCRQFIADARDALLTSPPREVEARCQWIGGQVDGFLSSHSSPALERLTFVLGETTRGAALTSAALMRAGASSPRFGELRAELEARSEEIATLVRGGTTSEGLRAAVARRDAVERELLALARDLSGGVAPVVDLDLDALANELGDRDAIVSFRAYDRGVVVALPGSTTEVESDPSERLFPGVRSDESLCAVVLRRAASPAGRDESRPLLVRVELGPIAPIQEAVRAWRDAIGATEQVARDVHDEVAAGPDRGVGVRSVPQAGAEAQGAKLRALILEPLREVLGNSERLILVLDDMLHLVPIDALPLDESKTDDGAALVGDRWRIETRCTLTEMLAPSPRSASADVVVALGGAAFDSQPLAFEASDTGAIESSRPGSVQVATLLRGSAWERGFTPLTQTRVEAREIADLFEEAFGGTASAEQRATAIMVEGRKASRSALQALAPRAKWLHVATHGWFASESIPASEDSEPGDSATGAGTPLSAREQVTSLSPMLLCGLALAGANLPEDDRGVAPGMLTAEELAAFDLTRCELAVLSACETNIGERRWGGQGVASLQKALQMAGARSVITSLWKVPDEATKELMLDFYRRLWVEKKSKHQALWEAKTKLRNAQDERGEPKYTTRDWAAWVLTGDPN